MLSGSSDDGELDTSTSLEASSYKLPAPPELRQMIIRPLDAIFQGLSSFFLSCIVSMFFLLQGLVIENDSNGWKENSWLTLTYTTCLYWRNSFSLIGPDVLLMLSVYNEPPLIKSWQ